MDDIKTSTMDRRSFIQTGGVLAATAAIGGSVVGHSYFSDTLPVANAQPDEKIVWGQCHVNCGGRCIFKYHVIDGKIAYVETDDTGDPDGIQCRACARGRSIRKWINHPDRLRYPMKRVGKRGEGKFERITWDEALDTIAKQLKYTIDKYGNEAICVKQDGGNFSVTSGTSTRFMNSLGGFTDFYNNYSTANMVEGIRYTFGPDAGPGNPTYASSMSEAMNSDLIIFFGNNPAETRMGGANTTRFLSQIRESGKEIIIIDPRMSESCASNPHEWQPIRTGTDAALIAALAHELIVNNGVDVDFVNKYCIGYDEDTMPESARGKHMSYKDYIMGTGYDMVEKTPEWAAPITLIPADRIREIAQKVMKAKALFVAQGWSSQRHSNGEITTRAICMLPILTGMVGKPGTNTGLREANPAQIVPFMPTLENPVKTAISCYKWVDAIDHGERMTALKDGVRGVDKLKTGIKFMLVCANNCLTNQHGNINGTHDVLADDSKCEFIVVIDTVLTDSAKYADILLPDAMRAEHENMDCNGYAEWYVGVNYGMPAQEPLGECRFTYDIYADICERLGAREIYTEGRTNEEWIAHQYSIIKKKDELLPELEDLKRKGIYKRELPPVIGLVDYITDPINNKLSTPSGKIEIYSEALEEISHKWELDKGDVISPIPIFDPGREGYLDLTDEYPLLCSGYHFKTRTHSSWGFMEDLKEISHQTVMINPSDAEPREIKNGETVSVKSPHGEVYIEARVTPRVIPGVVCIPEGAWHDADMDGDRIDHGGCVNTLLTPHATPLAKGNPSHSIIVQVSKVK